MASEQPEFTLTEIVAGDQSQYLSDTEKSAKKPGHKRRQNKSSKNRNKRKAKKEEEEYRKFMEELAVSVDARHREFGVKALLDLSGISRQGNHYEPFIVDSTNPRSTIQWQAGPGGFNSQYTGDTEPMSQAGSFDSHNQDHLYHSQSTTSHSSQNISMPASRISMGAPARSMPQAGCPDHYVIQSHGIYFGGHSDSTSSLPSETYSGYHGPLQSPSYPPPYQASQYCHSPVWQDSNQPMHPPGTSFEHSNRISQPCTRYFPFSNYVHNPPILQYRPTIEHPSFTPNTPFNEENSVWVRESGMAPNLLREGASKAERRYSEEDVRSFGNSLDSAQEQQQIGQLCTRPKFSHGNRRPPHDFGEELEPVAMYILEAFRSGEYTDFRLMLKSSAENCAPVSFPLHSLIASRSPHLKQLMKAMDAAAYLKEIHVIAAGSFSRPFALGMTLQHLYGVPFLDEEQLDSDLTPAVENSNGEDRAQHCGESFRELEKMNFALCYIASAAFLAESKILRRGIRLATNAICWDNLEVVLHFGISVSDFMITPVGNVGMDGESASSTTLRPKATALSNSSVQVVEGRFVKRNDPHRCSYTLNQELKDVWAPQLLNQAIEFIVKGFPQNFQLDPDAHSREFSDRLSGQLPSRVYIRDVSSVTFGSFAAAKRCIFRREESVMSAIFLAVPFKILKKLFNIMTVKGILTMSIAEDIVFERERRRVRAVRTVKKRNNNTATSTVSEADPIGWREEIMTVTGRPESSPSIIKTWVGLNVPEVIEIKPKEETSRGAPCSGYFRV
ncbi:hypothetical protein GX50_03263 [[Emmonsia] crescens]|uniref:Uncharacterized protein n=1 Tax=[Emmonsia] crescens TaxID=73230 RepID=A0A2B7ZLR5_9EURO|nr:hypothetical protein GX50_03263 [Emmonsia crescens]